jgi:hypothetical protein
MAAAAGVTGFPAQRLRCAVLVKIVANLRYPTQKLELPPVLEEFQ